MPLRSWPSGAKHAGSLYGGSLVRIADGLNLLSRKFTASHANHGAPYNTFLPSPTCMPSKLPAGNANALELRTDILCESGESYS